MKQHDETNILHQQQAQTISAPNQRPESSEEKITSDMQT